MNDESSDEDPIGRARDAASRGEWQQAYDLLVETDARSPLSAPELALLADMAYAAGHLDVTIASWERAYRQSVRAGDRLAAAGAAVRVAMHVLFDTALMAPVRAWARRVEQLLGRAPRANDPHRHLLRVSARLSCAGGLAPLREDSTINAYHFPP